MSIFLVVAQQAVADSLILPVEQPQLNLLIMIYKGGWLMIPIVLCSLIGVAIAIEKLLFLRKIRINTSHFMLRLRSLIMKTNIDDAIVLCSKTPGPIAKVLSIGISKSGRTKKDIQEIIESAGREEIYTMENHLGVLATIAAVAPMLGFLGTVTGMIRAFMMVQELGGNVNATVLAGGIWEALITTAAGLIVGIPAYLTYNYLISKIGRLVLEMEVSSTEIIDLLYSEEQNEIRNRKEIAEGL